MAGEEDKKVECTVDLEAVIKKFMADEDSGEKLELPSSLTAEQRKQAKKLVDLHSDKLQCESYGFGAERRLCVFKKATPQERVRVKNTFIDDWDGGSEGAEAALFRSVPAHMPVNLLERTLQRALGASSGEAAADIKLDALADSASPTSPSTPAELPPLPDGFSVRNTFIHIESVPVVERIVQSMPKGMFRQCLESELSEAGRATAAGDTQQQQLPGLSTAGGYSSSSSSAAAGAVALSGTPGPPPAAAAAVEEGGIVPGMEVFIQGLVKLPDFNGLKGVVQTYDPENGRYDVLLDGAAGSSGWRWVKVKGENCRPCIPPPPMKSPTVTLDFEGLATSVATAAQVPTTPNMEDASGDRKGPGSTPLKLNALV